MAWGLGNVVVNGSDNTAGTSIALAPGTVEVGNYLLVVVALDNLTAADGDNNEVTSVTDTGSNTYGKLAEWTNGNAVAAGATVSMWGSKITTQISGTDTVTANFSGSVGASAIQLREYTIGAGNEVTVAGTIQTNVGDALDPASQTISGLASQEYLFVHGLAQEGPNDTLTVSTNYTKLQIGTTGGGAASNMTVGLEWRIFTGTGDSVDFASATARDYAQVYLALKEAAVVSDTLFAQSIM